MRRLILFMQSWMDTAPRLTGLGSGRSQAGVPTPPNSGQRLAEPHKIRSMS